MSRIKENIFIVLFSVTAINFLLHVLYATINPNGAPYGFWTQAMYIAMYNIPIIVVGLFYIFNKRIENELKKSIVFMFLFASVLPSAFRVQYSTLFDFGSEMYLFIILNFLFTVVLYVIFIMGFRKSIVKTVVQDKKYYLMKTLMLFVITHVILQVFITWLQWNDSAFFGEIDVLGLFGSRIYGSVLVLIGFFVLVLVNDEKVKWATNTFFPIVLYVGYLVFDVFRYFRYLETSSLSGYGPLYPNFLEYYKHSSHYIDMFIISVIFLICYEKNRRMKKIEQ